MIACARPGCNKPCVGDGYCSADCCRIDHGLQTALTPHQEEVQRRRTESLRNNRPKAMSIIRGKHA